MRHRFHSMCPYFAMFPESFAESWIEELTQPGDLVLDPFSGRGTAPFQALLMGRAAVGGDINPVAYVLTRAKLRSPSLRQLLARIDELEEKSRVAVRQRESIDGDQGENRDFFELAFAPRTLVQLCYLRKELQWSSDDLDAMVAAVTVGCLHGEVNATANYLSNQMPRTISTKPNYSVKFWRERGLIPPDRDVFEVIRNRAKYRYESNRPLRRGQAWLCDMRELPRKVGSKRAQLLITSPPYLDTTSFEEDQWLRGWFLGGAAMPTRGVYSRDDRHYTRDKYWSMIADLWRVAGQLVVPGGSVVIRIAGRGMSEDELCRGLLGTSVCSQRNVKLVSSGVSEIVRRQTDAFRPGSLGLRTEVDCQFKMY
ncbi:MAG: hypothetical protein JO115_02590 [Pseudonocardiales bacterium]|nr:hypothetical protein [Pseudonocardiales bacterium]